MSFKPFSRICVATVVIGSLHTEIFRRFTKTRMIDYAKKCKASGVFVLDNQKDHIHPSWAKLEMHRLFSTFDRILYVDADVVIQSTAPDLFKIVPEGYLGAFDEFLFTPRRGTLECFEPLEDGSSNRESFRDWGQYYNAGVLMLSKEHQKAFEKPRLPEKNDFYEQSHLNFQFHKNKFKMFDIGVDFNRMGCVDRHGGKSKFESHFLHYAGLRDEALLNQLEKDNKFWR